MVYSSKVLLYSKRSKFNKTVSTYKIRKKRKIKCLYIIECLYNNQVRAGMLSTIFKVVFRGGYYLSLYSLGAPNPSTITVTNKYETKHPELI